MNWHSPFGRPTPEAKTAGALIALSQPAAAGCGGRDAGAVTRGGDLRNAIACRCVRMIAEAPASIPLRTAHPEAPNGGRFAAGTGFGAGFTARLDVSGPEAPVPDGAIAVRVAGIGPDGRTGRWLSIAAGSP